LQAGTTNERETEVDYMSEKIGKKLETSAKDCRDALQDFLNDPDNGVGLAHLQERCEEHRSLCKKLEVLCD